MQLRPLTYAGGPVRLTTEQSENGLRGRVRLGNGGQRRLVEYLSFSQVSGFRGDVRVTDARFGSFEVGRLRKGQVYRVAQRVLSRTDFTLDGAEQADGGRD